MPKNDDVICLAGEWTQLTDADVTAIRVQNASGLSVLLQATVGATAPSGSVGLVLSAGQTLAADLDLTSFWPGVAGANRVWALARTTVALGVSHA